jgi:hypothetical protein
MNERDHLIVELDVEGVGARRRSVSGHSCNNARVIQFLFCNRSALVKRDLAALNSVPLVVSVEVMGTHHDFGY